MKRILILSSNPPDSSRLRLDKEVRVVEDVLHRASLRNSFDVKSRTATRPDDIQQALLDYQPHIVHFCGHGVGEAGLVFEDDDGNSCPVSTSALATLFSLFSDQISCVVLNACYSEVQAMAITAHISSVIGMNQPIGDTAAILFAKSFYRGLGAGRSVNFSYKLGRNALELEGVAGESIPVLMQSGTDTTLFPEPNQKLPSLCTESDRESVIEGLPTKEHVVNDVALGMIKVLGGTFWMGSPQRERMREKCEGPQHKVSVDDFWIGKHVITQEQMVRSFVFGQSKN